MSIREETSPSEAVDFDNDGELDMALADELVDVVVLYRNGIERLFANGFE